MHACCRRCTVFSRFFSAIATRRKRNRRGRNFQFLTVFHGRISLLILMPPSLLFPLSIISLLHRSWFLPANRSWSKNRLRALWNRRILWSAWLMKMVSWHTLDFLKGSILPWLRRFLRLHARCLWKRTGLEFFLHAVWMSMLSWIWWSTTWTCSIFCSKKSLHILKRWACRCFPPILTLQTPGWNFPANVWLIWRLHASALSACARCACSSPMLIFPWISRNSHFRCIPSNRISAMRAFRKSGSANMLLQKLNIRCRMSCRPSGMPFLVADPPVSLCVTRCLH